METTKRRSDAFPYQVFPFLETQTMPGGSKFNAKKGSILLDNLHLFFHPKPCTLLFHFLTVYYQYNNANGIYLMWAILDPIFRLNSLIGNVATRSPCALI